jgi:hypothetical protein
VQRETGNTARSLGEQLSMFYVNDLAYDTPCSNSLKKVHRKKYILVNEGATGHSFGWMDIRVQMEMPVARRTSRSPLLPRTGIRVGGLERALVEGTACSAAGLPFIRKIGAVST